MGSLPPKQTESALSWFLLISCKPSLGHRCAQSRADSNDLAVPLFRMIHLVQTMKVRLSMGSSLFSNNTFLTAMLKLSPLLRSV
jgi:hypothetical protein